MECSLIILPKQINRTKIHPSDAVRLFGSSQVGMGSKRHVVHLDEEIVKKKNVFAVFMCIIVPVEGRM